MCAASGKPSKPRRAAAAGAPPARNPDGDRAFLISIVLLVVAGIAVHIIAANVTHTWMWGAHFYAFFPRVVLLTATLLLVAIALALLLARKQVASKTGRLANALAGWRGLVAAALAVVTGTALYWCVRICHTYLGDGNTIVAQIDTMQDMLPREPLTSLLQYMVYGITKPWFFTPDRPIEDVAHDAVAVGSVVSGFVFLAASWFLAGELARLRPANGAAKENNAPVNARDHRLVVALIWGCLVSQGFVQLFFGYIENYSFHAAAVVVFLWMCLRSLRGGCRLIFPAMALLLCFALHLASTVLVVPFVAVAWAALTDPERKRGAIRDLVCTGALVATAQLILMRTGYNPVSTLIGMMKTAFADRRNAGYMFTGVHVRDFFNEQILIGPLGMFLFIAGAVVSVVAAERPRGRALGFCLLAGSACLFACWRFGDSNLGYARDWDLLSHFGIVFTTAGLGLFLMRRTRTSPLVACLGIALAFSLYHTVPWIATNARGRTSLARLQTLPLGLGRTEVLVGEWYAREGDDELQRVWLERSVAAWRGNVNAHYLLGRLCIKQKRYDEAIASLSEAVHFRPDKVGYQFMLARAYGYAGQPAAAVPHLRMVLSHESNNMMIAMYLAEALYQAGDTVLADSLFSRIDRVCRPMAKQHPRDSLILATQGWSVFRLGRTEEARALLARAAACEPPFRESDCYLGFVLHSLGADDEARSHFHDCLAEDDALPPEIPDRAGVAAWLAASNTSSP